MSQIGLLHPLDIWITPKYGDMLCLSSMAFCCRHRHLLGRVLSARETHVTRAYIHTVV